MADSANIVTSLDIGRLPGAAPRDNPRLAPPGAAACPRPRGRRAAVRVPLALGLSAALAIALAGCAVGPDYAVPKVAVPAAYKEAAPGWKTAQPADRQDRGAWWSVFDDAQLNALETQVETANQTVAGFAAAYRQSRALVAEARSAYFPTLGLSASGTRSKNPTRTFNANTGALTGGGGSGNGSISNSFDLGLDASWEPDLWGKVSREVGSEKAGAQAAAADLANARLSAQATLAQDYFQLRALDAAQKLLDDTVVAFQKSLDLTRNRYAQGVAARSDVIQAQTQLQSAQAAAVDNGVARAQFEHAIAVLVGQPASIFSIAPAPLDAVPPTIPGALPSALLERRPDIAAAERRAAAANEQIGVAMSAFFPSLTLSASGGFESSVLSQLLRAPSQVWTLGPQLAATLFDGGLRTAQTNAARAAFEQSVANYRQTVLAAFQDVEDNLASLRILERENVIQQQAVASAQQALQIALNQYKAGTETYLLVITSQATAFSAEQRLAALAGQRMVAAVGLVKALGGGWSAGAAEATDQPTAPVQRTAPVKQTG
jgi:NodT family efflux transporter outer membrane factor (OMF) lipoprotein